jgi:hypothetical protein
MKAFLAAGAWFSGAVFLVVGAVVALFWIGVLPGISILFYRGLVFIAIGEALCFVILLLACRKWPGWKVRDAVSACAFAAGIALCLLIVLPVTIDRSISVFMLTQMAAQPDRAFTSADMRTIFVDVYVERYRQIERRLEEQEISGNVASTAAGFRITPQGLAFVRFAAVLSKIFATDRRFVTPAELPGPGGPPGCGEPGCR